MLDVQAPDSGARLRRAALLTVVIGQFAVQLASMPISAILPTLADAFQADFALISWVSGAYLLTLTGFLLVAGRLGDLYGHRRVYMVGIVTYSVAGGLGGLAPDALFLVRAGHPGMRERCATVTVLTRGRAAIIPTQPAGVCRGSRACTIRLQLARS